MWRVMKSRSRSRPLSSSSSCHLSDAIWWRKMIPPYACYQTPLKGFSSSLRACRGHDLPLGVISQHHFELLDSNEASGSDTN
jgi:hypothetical protein